MIDQARYLSYLVSYRNARKSKTAHYNKKLVKRRKAKDFAALSKKRNRS